MGYSLKCPACRGKFKWDVSKGYPTECQLCGEDIGSDGNDDVVMPFISLKARKGPDKLFRDMEAGAERRVEMASEQFNIPKSELSGLKMTNMRDGLREGDTAAVPVINEVTRAMDSQPNLGFQDRSNGVGYSPMVQTGPHPNAGAQTGKMITDLHGRMTPNLRSVNPALETQQPGYRQRV